MMVLRGMLLGVLIGIIPMGCSWNQIDQAADVAANADLIRQCGELRRELDKIEPLLTKVTDDELDRLEEVNAIRTVVCTADLRELTDGVRRLREGLE